MNTQGNINSMCTYINMEYRHKAISEYADFAPLDDPTLSKKALSKYKLGSFGKENQSND